MVSHGSLQHLGFSSCLEFAMLELVLDHIFLFSFVAFASLAKLGGRDGCLISSCNLQRLGAS